jgi:hypothetical protein
MLLDTDEVGWDMATLEVNVNNNRLQVLTSNTLNDRAKMENYCLDSNECTCMS